MLKLTDHLYLGRCLESPHASQGRRTLLYVCHWPCGRADTRYEALPECPAAAAVTRGSENGRLKFLDLVNVEIPHYRTADMMAILDLIDSKLSFGDVVLISERAESRAPSLALLWLAFRGRLISRSSFAAARSDFTRLCPDYIPWPGWVIFLEQEWDALR